MRRVFSFLVLLFLLSSCSKKVVSVVQPQITTFDILNIKIDQSVGSIGPCEPSICINPKNPDQILAGSILDRIHVSNDSGKTWKTSKLTSSVGVFGDPVVKVDSEGRFFYAHLSNPAGKAYSSEEFLDRIQVQRSLDGGETWSDGTAPSNDRKKDQDKQWLYVDPITNDILMSWTEFDKYGDKKLPRCSRILFSKSTDSGLTWSEPIRISDIEGDCVDDDYTTEGAVPVMDKEGNIYVSWSHGESIYLDKSTDGGKTWLSKDVKVAKIHGGWTLDIPGINRCNGMPILGIDRSGGIHDGTLYINWSDQKNGEDDTDIWLVKSTDGGKTWSRRKRVNDDSSGKHQFFTWMDIDRKTGYIYTIFYDRRAYEDHKTDVYLAYSTDGGETFTNKKISKTPFSPTENIFFGDYNNISAYDGRVRPVWTRLQDGVLSIWTALIEVK